jgi:hypothetical protein
MGILGRTAALALVMAVSGCSLTAGGLACTAIGHSTVIPIEITGPQMSSVAAVQLCSDDNDCSSGTPFEAPKPLRTVQPSPPELPGIPASTASNNAPSGPFSYFRTSYLSHGHWEIQTDMVQPSAVTARALDLDGVVLAEVEASLEWTRISGTEECGGNQRSTTIFLPIS